MTIEQNLYNGSRAKEVLENEAFVAAFEAIEQEVLETWKNSPARDSTGREKCWEYLMLLRRVKAHLVSTLETGKLAELELQHRQSMYDRARDGIRSLVA
jgi:hypothetical protein